MSTWTMAAASFRQARTAIHNETGGFFTDSKVEELSPNVVIEGRILDALHPGQVAGNGYAFQGPAVGTYYQGMRFNLPSYGWEQQQVQASAWTEPGWWGWTDFDFSKLLQAGLPRGYYDVLAQMIRVFHQAKQSLPFVPQGTWNRWYAAVRAGGLPFMISAAELRRSGRLPAWLANPYHQRAWDMVRGGVLALNRTVSAANAAQVAAEAQEVAQDLKFWDTVAKWSGAEAAEQQWKKLKAAVRNFNRAKQTTNAAIANMDRLVAEAPEAFTDRQRADLAAIKQRTAANTQRAQDALDGPIMTALLDEGMQIQGLGIAPVVIITLGVTVIAAAAGTIITVAALQTSTTKDANAKNHEFIMVREAYDNEQHARAIQAIKDRQQELDTLLQEEKLAPDEYERQMRALEQQAQSAGIELLKRREQTAEASAAYSDNLKQQADLPGEGAFSAMSTTALALAAGATAIFVLPRLLPKK